MIITAGIFYLIIGLFGLFFGVPIFWFLYKNKEIHWKISGGAGLLAFLVVSFFFHSLTSKVIIVEQEGASRFYVYGNAEFELKDGSIIEMLDIEDGEFIINNAEFSCVIERSDYRDYETDDDEGLLYTVILIPPMSSFSFPGEDIDYLFKHAPSSIKTGRKKSKRKLIKFELRPLTDVDKDEFYIYTGPVWAGTPEGEGIIIYDSISRYIGTFEHGRQHGNGTETYWNGESYTGSFVKNEKSGYGEYQFEDSSYYHGNWVAGQMEGFGMYTGSNGDIYEGNFVQGEMSGEGTIINSDDGSIYSGNFLNGLYNGQGTLTYSSGKKTNGIWDNGKYIGEN